MEDVKEIFRVCSAHCRCFFVAVKLSEANIKDVPEILVYEVGKD
jgi:hypothetical protein